MKKFKIFIITLIITIISTCTVAYAQSFSTYDDVTPTQTTVVNLTNYALNDSTFLDSDYVVFRNDKYSYYIVWGNLSANNVTVSSNGSSVDYVRYYANYNSEYGFERGTLPNFLLTANNTVVSNIQDFGFASSQYHTYKFEYDYYKYFDLAILAVGILFVIMIFSKRKGI